MSAQFGWIAKCDAVSVNVVCSAVYSFAILWADSEH